MDYLYDGSFDGLLTCIYHNYYQEPADGIYQPEYYHPSLLTGSTYVTSDTRLAARVYNAIEAKISVEALDLVYKTFLSSCPDKENLILNYLQVGFRMGAKIDLHHTHPDILPVRKAAHKVGAEVHRFLGLVRFADAGKFLYAGISPDHHILPLIADHFSDRLASECWIIHDKKRNLAVIYDGNNSPNQFQCKWYLTDFSHQWEPAVSQEEQYFQQLWQLYFNHISITTRFNPRLQSQFVPRRYRCNLVEFQPAGPEDK